MSDSDMAYLALCARGHFIGVTVDNPAYAKNTASIVASWIKRGAVITRMTVGEARPHIEFSDDHYIECLGRKPRKVKAQQDSLFKGVT